MTTKLGEALRRVAEKMASEPPGSSCTYIGLDGHNRIAVKDREGRGGLYHALDALRSRKSQGDEVSSWEWIFCCFDNTQPLIVG